MREPPWRRLALAPYRSSSRPSPPRREKSARKRKPPTQAITNPHFHPYAPYRPTRFPPPPPTHPPTHTHLMISTAAAWSDSIVSCIDHHEPESHCSRRSLHVHVHACLLVEMQQKVCLLLPCLSPSPSVGHPPPPHTHNPLQTTRGATLKPETRSPARQQQAREGRGRPSWRPHWPDPHRATRRP